MSDLFKYDVRVRARLLESGEISEEEIGKRLAALPDVSDRCDTVELQQPAIGRGGAQAAADDDDDDDDDDAGDET